MSTFFEVLYSRNSENKYTLTLFMPAGTPEEWVLGNNENALYEIGWWIGGNCLEKSITIDKVILILPLFSESSDAESFIKDIREAIGRFKLEFEIEYGLQILFTPQHKSSIKDIDLQFEQVTT